MRCRIILSGVLASLLTFGIALSLFAEEGRGRVFYFNQQGRHIELYQESHALIIGMSEYSDGWANLPGVKEDVQAVKVALEENGFQVKVQEI